MQPHLVSRQLFFFNTRQRFTNTQSIGESVEWVENELIMLKAFFSIIPLFLYSICILHWRKDNIEIVGSHCDVVPCLGAVLHCINMAQNDSTNSFIFSIIYASIRVIRAYLSINTHSSNILRLLFFSVISDVCAAYMLAGWLCSEAHDPNRTRKR